MGANGTILSRYIQNLNGSSVDAAAAAFYASLDQINAVSPVVATSIVNELNDQRKNLKLIASENFSSLATQLAHGNLFTDKYAEGFPGKRFYAGCDNVDVIEAEAVRLACELFGADHAYVQPHSGADANLVAFLAILSAQVQTPILEKLEIKNLATAPDPIWRSLRQEFHNQRMLALDYYSGGHLTHGYRFNISSHLFDVYSYGVDPETHMIDLDAVYKQLKEIRPLILLAGYSAYSRKIDFARMREMADSVGAVLMVDMAHFAGLVAGKVFTGNFDPVAHAHVVTSTTHKTLRGPRGGIVLSTKEYADYLDKGCPMVLGGPLPHAMAAKAVALKEASTSAFQSYAHKIVENAQALADSCLNMGMDVLTGGTDNHLFLLNVFSQFGITGRQAESALRECHITLNRNSIPSDPNGAWYTSGLRFGTPAVTTLGMGTSEMAEIAKTVKNVLSAVTPREVAGANGKSKPHQAKYDLDDAVIESARSNIQQLMQQYPLYPELDLDLVKATLQD